MPCIVQHPPLSQTAICNTYFRKLFILALTLVSPLSRRPSSTPCLWIFNLHTGDPLFPGLEREDKNNKETANIHKSNSNQIVEFVKRLRKIVFCCCLFLGEDNDDDAEGDWV